MGVVVCCTFLVMIPVGGWSVVTEPCGCCVYCCFFTVRHGSGISVPSVAWHLAAVPSVSSQTDGSSCLRSDRISSLMIKDRCRFTLFFLENKPRPPHVFSQSRKTPPFEEKSTSDYIPKLEMESETVLH